MQCNRIALLMISIVVQCNRRISNELELNCLISIVVQCNRNKFNGTNQFPNPPIITGITKKNIIRKAWAVTITLYN